MEALHFVLFAFAILNISSIALSLRCQKCGSYGEECSDDANVTIVDCDGFEDRCMTIITTTMITQNAEPPTKVMKDCAHSTMICQEQGPGYPCKEVPFGGSCNIECCDGDLCNQASSEAGNTTSYNVTNSGVVASSLTCEVCGPDRNPCGGDIVASVDCGEFADRCMTVSMTIGPITTVMKNCANSNFTCQEQGGGNPCKHASSFGGSCNMECCEGDMCNQASSEAGNTTAHNVTNPGVELSNSTNVAIRCYQCQPNVTNIGSAIAASGGASLGGVDLCNNPTDTVDCSQDPNIGSFADACYSASVTVNISLLNFGEVTYHVQGCAAKSMCPRLKKATCDTLKTTFAEIPGFGISNCDISCCKGDLCNNPSVSPNTASSLKCEACGPDGEPCGGDNVTSVECGGFADRCMTVTVTRGSNTMMMKRCAHSTVHCREQSEYNPCKQAASLGGSCNFECCEGDMCNQYNAIGVNSTKPEVAASSLKCEACGLDRNPCGGDNVTSVQCGGFEDRCMTISAKIGSNTMMIKRCAHSTLNCQEQSQYNPCKQAASVGGPCNFECCEGDMCNQYNAIAVNSTIPEVAASSLKCEVCGFDGNTCDRDNVESIQCGGFADRCMTISTKVGSNTMVMKSCGNSTLHCQEQSQYNPCKQAASLGGSCKIECCEGDMCNQYNTTVGNSTKAEAAASSLKCQKCGPMDDPCDEANVTSFECGGSADRCLTVSMEMGNTTMLVKNCGYSTLNCQNDSQYNPCKIAPIGASCNIRCCEGDMCNLASPSTTAAPSTTVSSPPTPPGTEPPPAVVKGRFFKVNSSPVCFGSQNNEFGRFSVPSTGDLAAIKLVHLYGYVACYSRAKWSIWGCGGPKVNVVITTSANDVILPPAEFSDAGHWSIIPGYTSLSPELVLSVFSRPRPVTSGEEFHLWYGEDFVDAREGDNRGTVCSDVYVLFF